MIPGMSQLMPQGSEKDGANRIQMFMVAMDSMTDDELDGIFKSRDRKTGKVTLEKHVSLVLLGVITLCTSLRKAASPQTCLAPRRSTSTHS